MSLEPIVTEACLCLILKANQFCFPEFGLDVIMNIDRNNSHALQVYAWENENGHGLSSEEIVHLFSSAIHAIEKRSLATLSSITLMVILDRALFECQEQFPILKSVHLEEKSINLAVLLEKNKNFNTENLRNALRHLLIQMLTVLGNITADILSAPLHKTLMTVTYDRKLQIVGSQNSLSAKSNREQS